jgi:hypothetical protein
MHHAHKLTQLHSAHFLPLISYSVEYRAKVYKMFEYTLNSKAQLIYEATRSFIT